MVGHPNFLALIGLPGRIILCAVLGLYMAGMPLQAQSLSFELKQGKDIHFVFNTLQKYQAGIIVPGATDLRIIADSINWDLYVGAITIAPGLWNTITTYANYGQEPPIGILELNFRNQANTSQVQGFFPITDISNPVYIIGSESPTDPDITCPGMGTNTPGDYLSSPQCYRFSVDIRIKPGFDLQPGLYFLIIEYIIVEDM